MSAGDVVTVNKDGVTIALRTLQLGLRQRESLLRQIGLGQLKSIYTTFAEQGSPAGSWVPLSPATVARNPKKYGSGHKLLIDKGILRNGFAVTVTATGVVLSNNVKYAAVQNNGSRDLVAPAVGIGPANRDSSQAAKVGAHVRTVKLAPRYELAEVEGRDGLTYRVPRAVYKEKVTIRDKNGRERTVTKLIADPGKTKTSKVGAHSRHQNIPARPFAVFRPEDPARIEKQVIQFVETAKAKAGLAGA